MAIDMGPQQHEAALPRIVADRSSTHQTVKSTAQYLGALRTAMEARDEQVRSLFLLEDGHEAHADVAFELGLIGVSRAIVALSKAVCIAFTHLVEWGNLQAFQRKCAYALSLIGTTESRMTLDRIVCEADSGLRECVEEGLGKWPLPYRP